MWKRTTCTHYAPLLAKVRRLRESDGVVRLGLNGALRSLDLVRLRPFISLDDVEFYVVTFLQALIPVRLNRRVVYEHIGTIFPPDESESFRIVEPLYLAFMLRHGTRTSPIQIGNREGILRI